MGLACHIFVFAWCILVHVSEVKVQDGTPSYLGRPAADAAILVAGPGHPLLWA